MKADQIAYGSSNCVIHSNLTGEYEGGRGNRAIERSGGGWLSIYEFEYKVDSTKGGIKRIFSAIKSIQEQVHQSSIQEQAHQSSIKMEPIPNSIASPSNQQSNETRSQFKNKQHELLIR